MSQSLCNEMTQMLSHQRPNCEEILKTKKKWVLKAKDLEINYGILDIINTKERENGSTIYLFLRSEFNLFKTITNSNTTRVHNCVIS
jgi:hypothetical protein